MTYYEHLQDIWHQFSDAHGGIPATLQEAVSWGADQGLIQAPKVDPYAKVMDDMRRALRDECHTDSLGRRHRVNFPARVEKNGVQLMWAVLGSAPHEHMVKHFADRRNQILGDCMRLKTDVDVYNDVRHDAPPIQLVLDFTRDVEEMQEYAAIEGGADEFRPEDELH